MGQQSACFTLHGIGADNVTNPNLHRFRVVPWFKEKMLVELQQLNINQYTIYDTLDHLSAAICESWEIPGMST